MLDDSLRRRLETLNRGPLPNSPGPILRASVPTRAPDKVEQRNPLISPRAIVRPLPGLLRGAEVVLTTSGEHLRICLPLEQLWSGGMQRVSARHAQLVANAAHDEHPEITAFLRLFPERTVFMDVEACGLAGAAIFLIGLIRSLHGTLTLELHMARNYAEEQSMLESFWQVADGCDAVVTFNGKSFDWPMVIDRSHRYLFFRARRQPSPLHVDLLHHARRRWKNELANCRLQTLEMQICHRRRVGDIAGHQIPAAYADYVRTGFERDMEAILYHNAVDLVSLLDISLRVGRRPSVDPAS